MHILNLDPDWASSENAQIPFTVMRFPAGEIHIKLKESIDLVTDVMIRHRIKSADDIFLVLFAADALRSKYKGVRITAFIPYMPFSRQDRPMVKGEPFSLRVLSKILALGNFESIWTLDPHSTVTPALIENLFEVPLCHLGRMRQDIIDVYGDFDIISPDAGALKKIYDHAKVMRHTGSIFTANKVRDVSNGKILRTAVLDDVKGRTVLILDDICSYGGTFKALAKELKARGAKTVLLAVTHYEGVANAEELYQNGIDHVYTTSSIDFAPCAYITRYNVY